jgi:methyltransferase (TIGR00027 family)
MALKFLYSQPLAINNLGMSNELSAISHVSDTAILVAGCRAVEAERADGLVRDPYAARLAGERGIAMFKALRHPEVMSFGIGMRTRFIDDLIMDALASGPLSAVVSLGSGLDTRPWRLDLPAELRWIEVDFAPMLDYKDRLLAAAEPRCRRERLALDVNDPAQRARLWEALGSAPALMITEGLLMYLPAGTVQSLASETSAHSGVVHWITDIVTTTFSNAIGGGGSRVVSHVQAEDHLNGQDILMTLYSRGWRTAVHKSYVRDVAFAADRIKNMLAAAPALAQTPAFDPNEQAGVHCLAHYKPTA